MAGSMVSNLAQRALGPYTLPLPRAGDEIGIVLANLSGRAWLPGANQVTIGGFVVQGSGQQRGVARGGGPDLEPTLFTPGVVNSRRNP